MHSVNRLHILRPSRVDVECGGRMWRLTASSAADWIGAIGYDHEHLSGVMPGLLDDEDLMAMHELARAGLDDEWLQAARTAVGLASGRDWWWAVNLSRQALGTWAYVNGLLLLSGVRADTTPFADWLDACYVLVCERGDEQRRAELDTALNRAPAGVKLSRQAVDKALADFAAD